MPLDALPLVDTAAKLGLACSGRRTYCTAPLRLARACLDYPPDANQVLESRDHEGTHHYIYERPFGTRVTWLATHTRSAPPRQWSRRTSSSPSTRRPCLPAARASLMAASPGAPPSALRSALSLGFDPTFVLARRHREDGDDGGGEHPLRGSRFMHRRDGRSGGGQPAVTVQFVTKYRLIASSVHY